MEPAQRQRVIAVGGASGAAFVVLVWVIVSFDGFARAAAILMLVLLALSLGAFTWSVSASSRRARDIRSPE